MLAEILAQGLAENLWITGINRLRGRKYKVSARSATASSNPRALEIDGVPPTSIAKKISLTEGLGDGDYVMNTHYENTPTGIAYEQDKTLQPFAFGLTYGHRVVRISH